MRVKKIIHHPAGEPDTSRRNFLRRAGLAGAAAAAFPDSADLVGVTTASASADRRSAWSHLTRPLARLPWQQRTAMASLGAQPTLASGIKAFFRGLPSVIRLSCDR